MTVFGKMLSAWTVPDDPWYTYLVKCADSTLYCGVTNDLKARLKAHNSAKRGARYTRTRRPVALVWFKKHDNKSLALRHEHEVKKLVRKQKETLIVESDRISRSQRDSRASSRRRARRM